MNNKNFKKGPKEKKTKIKTVNLFIYQCEMVKIKKIDLSKLCRFLVDNYFEENYSALLSDLKKEHENK